MITQERLKHLLSYNPDTGNFTWIRPTSIRVKVGDVASYRGDGYIKIRIDGRLHRAHRLAWLYVYGELPSGQIDHINHVRDDNRIENLRVVNNEQNSKNRPIQKNNKTGIHGISKNKSNGMWHAYITTHKGREHLGYFHSFFDACCARKSAESKNGYHHNHGFN